MTKAFQTHCGSHPRLSHRFNTRRYATERQAVIHRQKRGDGSYRQSQPATVHTISVERCLLHFPFIPLRQKLEHHLSPRVRRGDGLPMKAHSGHITSFVLCLGQVRLRGLWNGETCPQRTALKHAEPRLYETRTTLINTELRHTIFR